MENFKKEFKQLYTVYEKSLQKLSNESLSTPSIFVEYFINYLKFLRDYFILTEPLVLESGEENLKIATIASAIAAYEKYQTCKSFYNTFDKENKDNEAILNKYMEEKEFYWHQFWTLIDLNLERWTSNVKI